jgi:glucose-6-phosphate 1-dehydrogenase
MKKTPESCTLIVFGATGDLTKRKLVPALFNLKQEGVLPKDFKVIGISRKAISSEDFQSQMKSGYEEYLTQKTTDPKKWEEFVSCWEYLSGNVDDPSTFKKLASRLKGNCIFYLATPPSSFLPIIENLARAKLTEEIEDAWRRIIIEKPFGHDLESAVQLNEKIKGLAKESQIFRIDHYLGKETVQNIMVLRFANGIFEPIWNRRYIDHVQISVAEELGVEGRASYYEHSGALRDMVPNHLFQLLALVGMEAPNSFDSEAVRDEKVKVLQAIRPMSDTDIITHAVRGQYGPGYIGEKKVPGYRQEEGVNPQSNVETFAALKIFVDNWRWADVPFYLRTGKRLASRTSEISIHFKRAPLQIFRETETSNLSANELLLQIQPRENITLTFGAKKPGHEVIVNQVGMKFDYADAFQEVPTTGYETLISDCMIGDSTLFQRSDQIESAWKVVTPILQVWNALQPHGFPNYEAGSLGPKEADQLLKNDGRSWRIQNYEPKSDIGKSTEAA